MSDLPPLPALRLTDIDEWRRKSRAGENIFSADEMYAYAHAAIALHAKPEARTEPAGAGAARQDALPLEEALKRAYYYDEAGNWRGPIGIESSEWHRWHAVAKVAQSKGESGVALPSAGLTYRFLDELEASADKLPSYMGYERGRREGIVFAVRNVRAFLLAASPQVSEPAP